MPTMTAAQRRARRQGRVRRLPGRAARAGSSSTGCPTSGSRSCCAPSRTGPQRYSQLARTIAGVSQKMLTQTLRSLERDGMVTRTRHRDRPGHRDLRADRARPLAAGRLRAAQGLGGVAHGRACWRPGPPMMRSHDALPVRAVAALSVVGVLVLAAGCGGCDDKDGGDSDFAKQSGEEIAAAAKADMKDARPGRSTAARSPPTATRSRSTSRPARPVTARARSASAVARPRSLAKDGDQLVQARRGLLAGATRRTQADAIIAAVGDKWVLDTDVEFAQFCDLDAFFDNMFKDDGRTPASTRPPAPTRSTARRWSRSSRPTTTAPPSATCSSRATTTC